MAGPPVRRLDTDFWLRGGAPGAGRRGRGIMYRCSRAVGQASPVRSDPHETCGADLGVTYTGEDDSARLTVTMVAGRTLGGVEGERLDAEARFAQLFHAHHTLVLAYSLRRVSTAADAADVLAETFVVAWRRLPDVPVGDEALWLLGVARLVLRNVERGNLRRRRLANRLRAQIEHHAPASDGPTLTGHLGAALARLSTSDRELLLMIAWEGLSPAQAAVVLGISGDAARGRLSRARARLRAALEDLSRGEQAGHVAVEGHGRRADVRDGGREEGW